MSRKSNALDILLQGLGASDHITVFKEYGVTLENLHLLNDHDLCSMGIRDETLRQKILKHGKTNKNVELTTYIPIKEDFCLNIFLTINNHLNRLKSVIASICILFKYQKQAIDELISPEQYSSEAMEISINSVHKTLNKVDLNLNIFEKILRKNL